MWRERVQLITVDCCDPYCVGSRVSLSLSLSVTPVMSSLVVVVTLSLLSLLSQPGLARPHPHPQHQLEDGFPSFLSFLTSRLHQTKNRFDRRHHQPPRHQSKPCVWPIECGYGDRQGETAETINNYSSFSLNLSSRITQRGPKKSKFRFVCTTDINANRKCGFMRSPTRRRWGRNLDGGDNSDVDLRMLTDDDEFTWVDDVEYVDVNWNPLAMDYVEV